MANDQSQGLLSKYQILSLYLPAILLSLGTSMVAPVIPVFAKSFDVSFSEASLVFVVAQVGALLITFPSGYLTDKIGRRPVLLAGPILTALSSLMTPFANSFPEMLVYRFINGAATQLWMQARMIVIADTAAYDTRARQISWMLGMSRGGTLFGPSVGGFLAAFYGIQIPFIAHAVLTFLVTIPTFMVVKETAPIRRQGAAGEAAAEDPGWSGVIALLLTFQMLVFLFVQMTANVARGGNDFGFLNLYAVYAYDVGPEVLGVINTLAVVASLPVPFITGHLMDRFGRKSVIVPGFTSYACALVFMALGAFFSYPFLMFVAAYMLVQFTMGTVGGTMQVLGTDMAPPFARGRFFAIWRVFAQLGSTISPGVFALLADHVSYGVAFVFLAVCAFLVAFLVGAVLRDTRTYRPTAPPSASA